MSITRPQRGPGLGGAGCLRLLLVGPDLDAGAPKKFPNGPRVGYRSSQGPTVFLWVSWEKLKHELR
eukprot:7146210-Pyramimonas_sp.AAC.1